MGFLYGIKNYFSLFGPKGVFLAGRSRAFRRTSQIGVAISAIRHPLYLRLRNSDVTLLRSIFLEGEYDWFFSKQPHAIGDVGAYVGFTSIVIVNCSPEARILAIEPESSNCGILRKNAASYPQIEVIQAAFWKENTKLRIDDPGGGNWAFQTREVNASDTDLPSGGLVDAFTLDKVLSDRQIAFVDILKIDIEGSEKEVLECSDSWIGRVGVIVIELHDSFKPGCSEAI